MYFRADLTMLWIVSRPVGRGKVPSTKYHAEGKVVQLGSKLHSWLPVL